MMDARSADASTETMDDRTQKAHTEDIHVTDVRENADSLTLAVENGDASGSGEYDVQVSKVAPVATGCSCPDETFNSPEGGCKHRRYATTLLKVVGSLADDEYVSDEEAVAMVDAPADEARRALAAYRATE